MPNDLDPVLSGPNAQSLDLMRREAAAFRWLAEMNRQPWPIRRGGHFWLTLTHGTALLTVEAAMSESVDRTRQSAGGEGNQ